MPVSGSSDVHASALSLSDTQRDLESDLSRVHVNDQPFRESQADLEAGRADQEKTHSASTAPSPPPPDYFSFVSNHNETSAKTQLVAQKPVAISNNVVVEDVERGHARYDPESVKRQREAIRAIVKMAVVDQLAETKKDEECGSACCSIFSLVVLLILGIISLVKAFSA